MERCRMLEIVQTRVVDFFSQYLWISVCICFVLLPFLPVFMNTVHFYGEDTHKLHHDIETAMLKPVPVPSMWVDYQQLKNGSTYIPVRLTWEGMFETFILVFPWKLQITALLELLSDVLFSSIILHTLIFTHSLKQYTIWRIIMFLTLVALFSILLCLAADGTLTAAYISVRDSFLVWIESNIVELHLDDLHKDVVTYHPFTLGLYPPYFLTTIFRYLREDVVFKCEYNVTSDLDIEPFYVTTWWRKNGAAIKMNDRMYVNVSIESIDHEISFIGDFRRYLIRSTLTIEFIDRRDYGLYTCDYTNPLPGRVRVKNYSPTNDPNYETVKTSQPMTPFPKCDCQPTSHEKEENHSLSIITVCFSEFVLLPFTEATKIVRIRPGGILVTAASYRTAAKMSDIKVDVTFEGNSDRKGNSECCSLFIKIYWSLFGKGSLVDLPISRLLGHNFRNYTSQLFIVKYTCICINSFGNRSYIFYRDHFNTTIQKEEEIEIRHPVKVNIQPRDNGSVPLIGGFSFCHSSDQWWCQHIEALLDNSFYMVYTYDVFIFGGIMILSLLMFLVRVCSAVLIAKPLRKLCFPNLHVTVPFTAVEGPPVYINSNNDQTSDGFGVYLSYSEDDAYDKEVAKHVKALLTEAGVKVFDSVKDILPGQIVAYRSAEAISSSRRFLIVSSKTYVSDDYKIMEFAAIQDTIISRGSLPKDCMLIVKVEDCNIVGLHRVPCIHLPTGLKETFSLDQNSINRFYEWIAATRPVNRNETTVWTQLYSSGFTIKSGCFLAALLYLSAKSSVFITTTDGSERTDVANVV